MAFNPLLPVNGSQIVAAELRSQFTGLKDEIDTLAGDSVTQAQHANDLINTENSAVNTALPLTSANTNAVTFLTLVVSDPPTQSEVQSIASKLDELINALRR